MSLSRRRKYALARSRYSGSPRPDTPIELVPNHPTKGGREFWSKGKLAPPILKYIKKNGEWEWILNEPYTYVHKGTRITVPTGFEFDLASVPRVFWFLIAPFELSIVAALVHDFLYRTTGMYGTFDRHESDKVFREIMTLERVKPWRIRAAYRAVRMFAKGSWVADQGD